MHSGVSALAVIVFSIVTTIGCIPVHITHDDDFDVLLEEIVPGKTERGDVHKFLGLPRISNEEWGIEVYVRAAKWVEIYLPLPLFATDKAIVSRILLYDVDGTVRTTDGVGEGFTYYTYKRVLLAPKSEFKTPSHSSPNECTLYLLPWSSEEIKINGNYLTKGVMNYPYHGQPNESLQFPWGYYRLLLPLGKYNITFFDNFRGTGGEFSKITIDCVGSRIFYVRNKYKTSGFETILYDSPPNEMHKRRLIIYPAVPELIHLSDDKERAARGNLDAQWKLYKLNKYHGEYDFKWLCKAAEQGDYRAQWELGYLHYYGLYGVRKDLVLSLMYYSLVEVAGHDPNGIDDLRKQLSPEQLSEAEHLRESWKPGQCEREIFGSKSGDTN